jgi:hypothetical protein
MGGRSRAKDERIGKTGGLLTNNCSANSFHSLGGRRRVRETHRFRSVNATHQSDGISKFSDGAFHAPYIT